MHARSLPPPDVGRRRGYDPRMRERWLSRSILPRLPGLLVGLVAFGLGIALMVQAGLGLGPWEAFHQGIGRLTGQELGTISVILGLPILVLWWPLGERPGIGTLLNVVLIGAATNVGVAVLPLAVGVPEQILMMLAGVVTIGIGSGLYLGADLGPGPRDGLMTGLPPSVRLVDPALAHPDRVERPGRRLPARRDDRDRDGGLCPGNRAARPAVPGHLRPRRPGGPAPGGDPRSGHHRRRVEHGLNGRHGPISHRATEYRE